MKKIFDNMFLQVNLIESVDLINYGCMCVFFLRAGNSKRS